MLSSNRHNTQRDMRKPLCRLLMAVLILEIRQAVGATAVGDKKRIRARGKVHTSQKL